MGISVEQWRCAIGSFHPRDVNLGRITQQRKQGVTNTDCAAPQTEKQSVFIEDIYRGITQLIKNGTWNKDDGITSNKKIHHESDDKILNKHLANSKEQQRVDVKPNENISSVRNRSSPVTTAIQSFRISPQLLVIIAILLLIGGIEANPGPTNEDGQVQEDKKGKHSRSVSESILKEVTLFFHKFDSDQRYIQSICLCNDAESYSDAKQILSTDVQKHGLQIVGNNATGDCLFEALAQQLEQLEVVTIDHRDLRQNLVTYVKSNYILVSDSIFNRNNVDALQYLIGLQIISEKLYIDRYKGQS